MVCVLEQTPTAGSLDAPLSRLRSPSSSPPPHNQNAASNELGTDFEKKLNQTNVGHIFGENTFCPASRTLPALWNLPSGGVSTRTPLEVSLPRSLNQDFKRH